MAEAGRRDRRRTRRQTAALELRSRHRIGRLLLEPLDLPAKAADLLGPGVRSTRSLERTTSPSSRRCPDRRGRPECWGQDHGNATRDSMRRSVLCPVRGRRHLAASRPGDRCASRARRRPGAPDAGNSPGLWDRRGGPQDPVRCGRHPSRRSASPWRAWTVARTEGGGSREDRRVAVPGAESRGGGPGAIGLAGALQGRAQEPRRRNRRFLRCLHDHPLPGVSTPIGSLSCRLDSRGPRDTTVPEIRGASWIRSRLKEFVEPPFPHVFLHADLTADHILLTRRDDGSWFVSGIIDFGDARIGHPFYDFIAVIADYTLGEPELSHQLLEAYGMEARLRSRRES